MRGADRDGAAARKLEAEGKDGQRPGAGAATPAERPAGMPVTDQDDGQFDGQYRIKLESFEGPLDLLLHLIQQHELDILDIPVSFITEKYLEYLKLMQVLSIEIASEYLVMAATLVHIKSKMLLPAPPPGQDDGMPQEEEEDPRAELVRRLLEYQKYKAAAAELAERGTLGRDVFPRGVEEEEAPGPAAFAKVEVFGLLEAFEKLLKKTKVKIDHEVVFDRISITDRIVELTEKLQGRRAVRFEWLFLGTTPTGRPQTRFDLVITFLAMLEMCRMKLLRVYQTGPLAPIYMGLIEEGGDLSTEDQALADKEAVTVLADEPPPAPGEPEAARESVEGESEEAVIEVPPAVVDEPSVEQVEEAPPASVEEPSMAVVQEAPATAQELSPPATSGAVVEEASAASELESVPEEALEPREADAGVMHAFSALEEVRVEAPAAESEMSVADIEAAEGDGETLEVDAQGPAMHGDVPHAVGDVPHAVGDVPHAMGDVPHAAGDVPHAVGDVPHAVGDVPHAVGDVPQAVGDVPHTVGDVPQAVGDVPQTVGDVPEASDEAPQPTNDVPDEASEPPGEVSDDG